MTTYTPSAHPAQGFGASALKVAGWIVRRVLMLVRLVAHRREVRQLLELDERQLRDIGLLRNDVLGAMASPLGTDPSYILLVRSVERRAGRRLAAVPRIMNRRSGS